MMDKIREEFDSWWRNANPRLTDLPKEQAYYIWKASRAAMVVELSKLPEASEYGSGRVYTSHVEDALDKAGIRYE